MKIEQVKENFDIEAGAPLPTILSNEHHVYLIFYIENHDPNWDGSSIQARSEDDEGIATIKFHQFSQFKFGYPNNETIQGHPYYRLGLEACAMHKVTESDWIKELIKMNSVHPYHSDEQFSKSEHFIFYFHDSCFEIIAEGYTVEENTATSMRQEIQRVSQLL